MAKKVGDRVGAILGTNDDGSVGFFGYGEYVGYKVPPPGVILFGVEMCRVGHENPCVRLDNGDEVYGCECWWGPEEQVRKQLDGKEVREAKVAEIRERNRAQYTEEELAEAVKDWPSPKGEN
jgi:hypothetical protein